MPSITELSIDFSAGTKPAIDNIMNMANAVNSLASNLKGIEGNSLKGLADGLKQIKSSIPTKKQTENMTNFATAVQQFATSLGNVSITQFSNDMANMSNAVQGMGARSVKSLTNAAQAMSNLQQQAKSTASSIPKMPSQPKFTPNTGSLTLANDFKDANSELQKSVYMANNLKGIFAKIVVPTNKFKALGEQAEKIRTKYNELRESISKALESGELTSSSKGFEKQQKELQALRNEYDRLIQKQKELALSGGAIQLNPTVKGTIDAFSNGVSRATNVVKRGFHAALKGANNALKSFAGHLKNAAKSAKDTVTGGVKATDMAKKFANELLRVSKMLKLMVTRMALRKVIAEVGNGFKSLAIHSDEFNNSVSSMMNASKQLGYSFSAMVAPLINALAPAIEYIISLLVKLLNVFNQVISALTGASTWNRAKKFTDSWRDSITGAGKAASKTAKELKKTVLGFDELNQLQDNKSSDSGGGAGGLADMFETAKIDPKWKDFADWLKEMWKNKDFYDLGKLIGEKLRDTLESIPWDKIRKTSNDLGKALATLINGFVEVERLAYDIGYTVAQGVNTVFEFINGFVHNLHWDSIGKFIADTFNGFFENIDWPLIKDTVVTGLAGIAQAIQSFIDEFHWDNLSNFFINAMDTISAGIKAFFEGIDWLDLGKKIGDQITKALKGTDWKQVGEAIGDIFKAAIDFLAGFIETMDVQDVVDALGKFFEGFTEKVDSQKAGENIGKILQGLIDIIKGFWSEHGDEVVDEVTKFLKGIWNELDKEDIIKVVGAVVGGILLSGFGVAVKFLLAEIAKQAIGELIVNALFGGAAAGGAGAAVGGAAGGAAASGGLLGSATVAGSSIGVALVGGLTAFLAGSEIGKWVGKKLFPEDKDLYDQYKGIEGTFRLYGDFFRTLGEEIGENVGKAWDKVKEKTADMKEKTGEKLNDAVLNFADFSNKVVYRVDEVKTSLGDLKDKAAENLKNFNDNVSEKVSSVKEKFGDLNQKITEKKDSIVASFADLDTKAKEKFDNLKSNVDEFGTKWNERWADAKSKLDEAKTNIQSTLEDMKSDFTSFKEKVSEAFSKDNWTFSGVMDGLKKTFEGAKDAIAGVWNSIADKLNGEFEVGSSKFKINLPKFAGGGFPEDGLFMANHNELVGTFNNGKTAVANNEQIVKGIENGVYNAVMSAMSNNNSGSSYISNEIIVDGEVIARSVTKAQEKINRRYSPQTT